MSASAYGGYDAAQNDFSSQYAADTGSQSSYTVYDPPTDDPDNVNNYNNYKPGQNAYNEDNPYGANPYSNSEASTRSPYGSEYSFGGSDVGSNYKQDGSTAPVLSSSVSSNSSEPVGTGASAFGRASLNSSGSSTRTVRSVHSVVPLPDVSESETDTRRREAFHPYFEIKSNLTNILKDFTDLDSPYKNNIFSYKNGGANAGPPVPHQQEPIPLSKQRDWNSEFQELLDRRAKMDKFEKATNLEESIEVYERLSNLEKDFVYAATLYGRIIISEQYQETKTLKPVPMGGVAGGTKYVVNGILFKFVKDDSKLQLYGSDEFAMKAASHEKNGLVSLYHCGIQELRIPLMAYIDYRGHRLMAISILPIDRNTLVYGSNDGGTHVHMDDTKFNDLMRLALGQRLNLKQHTVGADKNGVGGKMIYGPADIEGHIGHDGRYYVLDFARLAPPEPVTCASPPGQFLYQLLRLELVRTSMSPLSSDAYSWIGRIDGPVHNAEVRKIYKHLLDDIIPDFAEFLDANDTSLDNIEEFIYNLHSHGINVRQLGYLRAKVTNEEVKNKILAEAVSRVIKNQLRYMFRQEMIVSGTSDEAYRRLTVNFLNLVFGGVNMNFTRLYWNDVIKNDLQVKFKKILAPNEAIDVFDICVNKLGQHLIARLSKVSGIRFQKSAIKSMSEGVVGFRLVDPDLKDLDCVVTRLNMIDYSDGMALFYKAKTMEDVERSSQLRLLTMARNRLRAARYSMCSTEEAIYYNAIVEQFMAKLQKLSSVGEREAALISAEQSFDKLLQMRTYIQHDIIISKAKCLRSRAKLTTDTSVNLPLYELALTNIKQAMQIENSDISLYLMAKTLLLRWKLTAVKEDIQEAEKLMSDAHERDPSNAAYAYGLAQILLAKHTDIVHKWIFIADRTHYPVECTDTEDDCQNRKMLVQRIGQLMHVAVTAMPKLYSGKVLQRVNEKYPNPTMAVWLVWGWAQHSSAAAEVVLQNVKDTELLNLPCAKYVDESLITLMEPMSKLKRFNVSYSRDDHNSPLSSELVKKLVAAVASRVTYIGIAASNATSDSLAGVDLTAITKLDATECPAFDVEGLRMPALRSLKLVGSTAVTDESLIPFLSLTPDLDHLYLPDSITQSGFRQAIHHCLKLRALRPPACVTEDDLRDMADFMPELVKLDLHGCHLISNDFVDSLNHLFPKIVKVRDPNCYPHMFSGGTKQRIGTRKTNFGNRMMIDLLMNGAPDSPVKIEKVNAANSQMPVKFFIRVDLRHKLVRFKTYKDTPYDRNELFIIQRHIQMAMIKFTFSNSPTVFAFHGPTPNFGNQVYPLYGHETRITGILQNDNINLQIAIPNDVVARLKQANAMMLWLELEEHCLNINMLIAVIVVALNKELK